MIWDLIWAGGLVWCQFVDSSLYLCHGDDEASWHWLWVVCIWNVAEVCWWWGWKEGKAGHRQIGAKQGARAR